MCSQRADLPRIDCLVLSGGGAKGSYGAGAAKALYHYRKHRGEENHRICLIGTSAGALNACALAAFGPDHLVAMWGQVTNRKIIGRCSQKPIKRFLLQLLNPWECFKSFSRCYCGAQRPYSLYSNKGLNSFIKKSLDKLEFSTFADRNVDLIIPVTNYSEGELNAFYVSRLVDEFKRIDADKEPDKQRIQHLIQITDKNMLISALLASASIPFAFPPVTIDGKMYIDGGVGNNTPTREAALFLRFVHDHDGISRLSVGNVYCVMYDPPGNVMETDDRLGRFDIASRTYDIFHSAHMEPIIRTWQQINNNVKNHNERVDEFHEILTNTNIPEDQKASIRKAFDEKFGSLRGALERLNIDLHKVRPSTHLGSTLDFSRQTMEKYIDHGYKDMIGTLRKNNSIDEAEEALLLERIHAPVETQVTA